MVQAVGVALKLRQIDYKFPIIIKSGNIAPLAVSLAWLPYPKTRDWIAAAVFVIVTLLASLVHVCHELAAL